MLSSSFIFIAKNTSYLGNKFAQMTFVKCVTEQSLTVGR